MCSLRRLVKAIDRLAIAIENNTIKPPKGIELMFIVKDNNPAVGYQISGVQAVDAEGHSIPDAKLAYEVKSTDTSVLEVTPDANDQTKGTLAFGAPGMASVEVAVKDSNGNQLGALGAQFTVTTGDVAAITGGSIAFDGLTEAPNP